MKDKIFRYLKEIFNIPHILATAIWVVLILFIGTMLGRTIWLCAEDLLALGKTPQEVTITVAVGDDMSDIAKKLEDSGMIRYANLFELFAKITGKGNRVNVGEIKFDGNTNAWATVYDNGDYYLGTYNTYNTVSSSKTSYITVENTGVDQFPLNYVLAGAAAPSAPEEGGETPAPTGEVLEMFATTGTLNAEAQTITWATANCDILVAKDASTTDIRVTDADHFRCYKDAKFTATAKNGKTIAKMVVTMTEGKYADVLKASAEAAGFTVEVNGSVVTITINNAKAEWSNTAQYRIKTIEFIYA